jgi:hypothetical protein
LNAPGSSHEAAEQLLELQDDLEQARTYARQYGTAADRAEWLYRRERSKAAVQITGRNDKEREAKVLLWPLDEDAQALSVGIAGAMGLGEQPAETVGDLRWMRDRAQRLADEWSATAYDRRNRVSAWMTVASMAKTEAELGGSAPDRPLRAVEAGGR